MSDYTLTCGACGHASTVPVDPEKSIYTCSECSAATTFGVTMPLVRILPHDEDRRFIRVVLTWGRGDKAGEVELTLAREYGAHLADELLSVCDVGTWKALRTVRP